MSGGGGGLFEEEHEEHVNHEAWVIPYADMLTLLMALFLMLFAMSTIDLKKFEKLAIGLNKEFGGDASARGPLDGGISVLDGAGPAAVPGDAPTAEDGKPLTREQLAERALVREEAAAERAEAERAQLDQVEAKVKEGAALAGVAEVVGVRREARGLIVTIVADRVVFEPGQAAVRAEGRDLLAKVVAPLVALPNRVAVEGHTDDLPISTPEYRSNWELSTARATEVLRMLVDELGLPADRVSAAGYAETRPVASNADPGGRARNRRVELAVLAEAAPG